MILLRAKTVPGLGRTRVCNADCYLAKNKACHCICGGLNHGIGLAKAREVCRSYFTKLAERDPGLEVVLH